MGKKEDKEVRRWGAKEMNIRYYGQKKGWCLFLFLSSPLLIHSFSAASQMQKKEDDIKSFMKEQADDNLESCRFVSEMLNQANAS